MIESPTPPQPKTATDEPGVTFAVLIAAPTPVITPQPIRQARSKGISLGTGIAPDSGTTQYSAWEQIIEKWCSFRPPRVRREVPSSRCPLG